VTVRGLRGMAMCELDWRRKWRHGGATFTVSSTWGKNYCSVRSWTWRGSRWCYGSEEWDNGTQFWWFARWWSLPPLVTTRLREGDREEMRWREGGREWGVGKVFNYEHARVVEELAGHGCHTVAQPWAGQPDVRLKFLNLTGSELRWPTNTRFLTIQNS
jgi:hypothetical protein